VKHLPFILTYVLFTLFILGFVTLKYKRRNGPIRFQASPYCIGCRKRMSFLVRLLRDDGYCSLRCRKMDIHAVNTLAQQRLHENHLRLLYAARHESPRSNDAA
jgi:hypothetical protein